MLQGVVAETGKKVEGKELGGVAQLVAVSICNIWPLTSEFAVPHSVLFLLSLGFTLKEGRLHIMNILLVKRTNGVCHSDLS